MDSRPQENEAREKRDELLQFAPERREEISSRAPAKNTVTCCTRCGVDWRGRCEGGGLLFDRKPICPDCAPAAWDQVRDIGAECLVEDFPRAGEDFAAACARWANEARKADTRRRPFMVNTAKS